MWRLEPEEAAEALEPVAPWSVAEGVSSEPEGKSRHRYARAKMARKEIEAQTREEEKGNSKASHEEGAEIQKSPKREVIRVESEETRDYVRETLNLSLEEAEEMSFVSIPAQILAPRIHFGGRGR